MKIVYASLEAPRPVSRGKSGVSWSRRAPVSARAGRKILGLSVFSLALVAVLLALSLAAPGVTWGGRASAQVGPPPLETVAIYAGDCVTPKTTFYLGETVCAVVQGSPSPTAEGVRQRSLQWVSPHQWVSQQTELRKTAQKELFVIPSSGIWARTGTWAVRTVDNEPGTKTITTFIVRSPRIRYVDLLVELVAPVTIEPGETIQHQLWVSNYGPDDAKGVEFVVDIPSQTTFAALKQLSGKQPFSCTAPARGETGRVVCNADYIEQGDAAEFALYYSVDKEAKDESVSTGTAEVYNSSTEEASKENNFASVEATVIVPR